MAQDTIDQHLITQFADMMHNRAQQIKARTRPYVNIKKMDGEQMAYDGLGQVDAREIQGRFVEATFDDIEHFRRKITRRRFVVNLPMDDMDIEGKLRDPQGDYATACVRAMERVFDRVVYECLFATVLTGRDFETSVSYATDGGFTVNATAGLTYEKLLEINQNWIDADVGNDMPVRRMIAISGDEHTDLMTEVELTSGDYSRQYVVDSGEVQRAVGLEVVKFAANARRPILAVNSGTRDCFALAEGGVCVGLSRAWKMKIQERSDYIDTTQLQIVGVLGAVRTEGILVQKVQTTD